MHTAATLLRLGATDEAIAMYRDAAIELGVGGWGQSESALGRMHRSGRRRRTPGDRRRESDRGRPSTPSAGTRARPPSTRSCPGSIDPAMHLAGIDALERMATPEATEALARRSSAGDVIATRALARLRDGRALAPLLELLASADPATAFRGADGLRDLRDAAATEPLLAAVDHPDPDVAVCATHALISMASPRTPEALSRLSASPDPQARALAAHWEAAWARRAVMPD